VFSKYGTIQQCTAFYDQHGRATGRAEIVYALRADAEAAVKALHNVEADGKYI
jgi:THO complex subunit 4